MAEPSSPSDAAPPGDPGSLRPGARVVGRYELQRELGRGGMGVVWLALDHTLQRQVAFKVLPDILRQDRTALVDLRDETRRNLEITHPHIVRIYDFEEDESIDVEIVPASRVLEMISTGELRDAKSMLAILLAERAGLLA